MGDVVPFTLVRGSRPRAPETLGLVDDFAPDQDGLGAWASEMFIDPAGPLYNRRHEHLQDANIGWLWTTFENRNRDRLVAGECQLVAPIQKRWASARQHWLLQHWFGLIPDFTITIDAGFAATCDDWSFCALIEHELCHAAQDVDDEGEPRFDREGRPVFRLITHDVEQFDDVVERYGARAANVERMVRLANAGPIFGEAQLSAACGTCSRRTA